MIIFRLLVIVTLIVLGVVFKSGKGSSLIAGYNTASKDKKSKINEKALLSFMGKAMFLLACSYGVLLLSDIFASTILNRIGLVLFFSIAIFLVIYVSVSKKFKK